MTAFFALYALTISIELVLSLVMALFLYLILSPRGKGVGAEVDAARDTPPPARTVEGALMDAFAAVSQGRDELVAVTHARALLVRYQREWCVGD